MEEKNQIKKNLWQMSARPRIKKAAAISYDQGEGAPRLIAKGAGLVADNILKVAQEETIAVVENPELVEELSKIDLGDHIPPDLYQIVAEVLIFVSDLDDLRRKTQSL